jgi:hypothetical protein
MWTLTELVRGGSAIWPESEKKPSEPDLGNASVGKLVKNFPLLRFQEEGFLSR